MRSFLHRYESKSLQPAGLDLFALHWCVLRAFKVQERYFSMGGIATHIRVEGIDRLLIHQHFTYFLHYLN